MSDDHETDKPTPAEAFDKRLRRAAGLPEPDAEPERPDTGPGRPTMDDLIRAARRLTRETTNES
jgi:hypothetical protein